jgi:hypothetical protein
MGKGSGARSDELRGMGCTPSCPRATTAAQHTMIVANAGNQKWHTCLTRPLESGAGMLRFAADREHVTRRDFVDWLPTIQRYLEDLARQRDNRQLFRLRLPTATTPNAATCGNASGKPPSPGVRPATFASRIHRTLLRFGSGVTC